MKLTSSLSDIREWMCSNLLELNQDKTELMIFAPKQRAKELTAFGGNIIHDIPYVKNLGAYFDRTLSYDITLIFHTKKSYFVEHFEYIRSRLMYCQNYNFSCVCYLR
jgi:hypothetical protein